jgi:hypothetical protein
MRMLFEINTKLNELIIRRGVMRENRAIAGIVRAGAEEKAMGCEIDTLSLRRWDLWDAMEELCGDLDYPRDID